MMLARCYFQWLGHCKYLLQKIFDIFQLAVSYLKKQRKVTH